MAVNLAAINVVTEVGRTPGYTVERLHDGTYKLTRLAIPKYGIIKDSMVVSPRAGDRQWLNAVGRIKAKLGWTKELFDRCQEIDRQHRIANTDPADEQHAALLEALGVDTSAPQPQEAAPVPAPRRRHGGGGTATGSAKKPVTAAVVADPGAVDGSVPQVLPTKVYHQLELITPERAVYLLLNMAPYQRDTKQPKANTLGGAMSRGEFLANPADSVCIDTNGQTCNGGHRLTAVYESGTAQPMFVAYNVPPETYRVMDRGTKRSTADTLTGAGEVNTAALAAAAKLAWLWFNVEQGQWAKVSTHVTEAQISAVLEAHPDLRTSVDQGKIGGGMSVSRAAAMLAHYLISRNMGGDPRLVTRWYESIAKMQLSEHQPGHTLGLYFLRSKPGATRRKTLVGRTRREVDLYLIIQAWNNTCLGKEMRTVGVPHATSKISDPIAPIAGRHQFLPFEPDDSQR